MSELIAITGGRTFVQKSGFDNAPRNTAWLGHDLAAAATPAAAIGGGGGGGGGGSGGNSDGCASGVAAVLLEATPGATQRLRGRLREQWDEAEAVDTDAAPPPKARGAKRGQLGAVPQAADCTKLPSKRRINDVHQWRRRHGGSRGEAPGDLRVCCRSTLPLDSSTGGKAEFELQLKARARVGWGIKE